MEWWIPLIGLYLLIGFGIGLITIWLRMKFGEPVTISFLLMTVVGMILWIFILGYYSVKGYRAYKEESEAMNQAIEGIAEDDEFKEFAAQILQKAFDEESSEK